MSTYSFGLMGYDTPNIDRIAAEGAKDTDDYAEQSCTAGRSTFITGQSTLRTGLSKVGLPGANAGMRDVDVTLASALKDQGYATGQFGKNHLGDRDEHLPTEHGRDEFFGNLYHLMPRKRRNSSIILRAPNSANASARAACCTPTRMARSKTPAP